MCRSRFLRWVWRCVRGAVAMLVAANLLLTIAWAHGDSPPGAPPRLEGGVAILAVALLTFASVQRLRRRGGAAALIVLSLWVLPNLSLHLTHHALSDDVNSCTVLQIASSSSQACLGISFSLAPLTQPYFAGSAPPFARLVLATPQPKARSPPALRNAR